MIVVKYEVGPGRHWKLELLKKIIFIIFVDF